MKYRENSDRMLADFIKRRLQDNDGYCASVVDSRGKEEYLCPCKDFCENVKKGEACRCGLYVKVKK